MTCQSAAGAITTATTAQLEVAKVARHATVTAHSVQVKAAVSAAQVATVMAALHATVRVALHARAIATTVVAPAAQRLAKIVAVAVASVRAANAQLGNS